MLNTSSQITGAFRKPSNTMNLLSTKFCTEYFILKKNKNFPCYSCIRFWHWLILTASEIDAEKGECRFQSNLSENSRETQQHRREGHFLFVFLMSQMLRLQWLTSATDAPHVRWDCSPTGSAGLAYPQSRPGYPDQLPPQSSGFAVTSAPHCPGSLSVF